MEIFVKSQPKYAIDIERMLILPASVYWKDIRGVYLGCNDVMAEIVSAQSRNSIIGLDDATLVGDEAATQYIDNDNKVIINERPQIIEEFIVTSSGKIIKGLSTKAPLYDSNGTLVGLWGISYLSNEQELTCLHNRDHQNLITPPKFLQDRLKPAHMKLSDRELQCLQLLANGFTAKAIGDVLQLSRRTIETYIENAKAKLGCNNKAELIMSAIRNKYIEQPY